MTPVSAITILSQGWGLCSVCSPPLPHSQSALCGARLTSSLLFLPQAQALPCLCPWLLLSQEHPLWPLLLLSPAASQGPLLNLQPQWTPALAFVVTVHLAHVATMVLRAP